MILGSQDTTSGIVDDWLMTLMTGEPEKLRTEVVEVREDGLWLWKLEVLERKVVRWKTYYKTSKKIDSSKCLVQRTSIIGNLLLFNWGTISLDISIHKPFVSQLVYVYSKTTQHTPKKVDILKNLGNYIFTDNTKNFVPRTLGSKNLNNWDLEKKARSIQLESSQWSQGIMCQTLYYQI